MASTNMKNASGKKVTKKKKIAFKSDKGQVHIHTSFNNTIVTFTDSEGNAISWCSSGKLGLKGSKKSTPFAAQTCVQEAAKVAVTAGIKSVEVYVKGPGQGRDNAIREVQNSGINVTLIKDVSGNPHNGCRPPKVRRV